MSVIFLRFFLFVAALVLAGCNGNGRELGMAGDLDIEMRRVCVGRYVMDVPARLTRQYKGLDGGGDASFYFGHDQDFTRVDVTVSGVRGGEGFESAVLARESGLRQKRHFATGSSMLVGRESPGPGLALFSSYASPDSTDAVRLEMHTVLDDTHVVLAETAYSAETRDGIQSRLATMAASLRSTDDVLLDAPKGFCIDNVVFDPGNDYEETDLAYAGYLDGVPVALHIDINTFEQASDDPGLSERGEANLDGLGIRPERLRAGPRLLAGDAGDEWLGAFADGHRQLHGFYAETRTRLPSRRNPKLLVSLSTGDEEAGSAQAGMDEGRAVALWDRIIASIRKRPG
ncbi:hypothetical protein LY625_00745 [Lysobacter sp. GX 14042]|uniref:T6SS immunity protein Tli4 family protein n=1 Tax=Lysobacter sp. GX 14042 TaxID=2907155 RepID=UPI001EECCC1B|nr:T6SS immunity protein Tli4 family protein [Lysobacter sp. GX 14042]MCE7031167.1 hypothetical protein [Lysobacter sp. GX 14042]